MEKRDVASKLARWFDTLVTRAVVRRKPSTMYMCAETGTKRHREARSERKDSVSFLPDNERNVNEKEVIFGAGGPLTALLRMSGVVQCKQRILIVAQAAAIPDTFAQNANAWPPGQPSSTRTFRTR